MVKVEVLAFILPVDFSSVRTRIAWKAITIVILLITLSRLDNCM